MRAVRGLTKMSLMMRAAFNPNASTSSLLLFRLAILEEMSRAVIVEVVEGALAAE